MTAPSKVLNARVSNTTYADFITEAGNPYENFPFRWSVSFTVETQSHGYTDANATPPIFNMYDGTHVTSGMWFATNTGRLFKISSITTTTSTTVDCVLEDVGYYNYYVYNGESFPGDDTVGLLFDLDASGHPLVDPYPNSFFDNEGFGTQLISRLHALGITTGGAGGSLTFYDEGNELGPFSKINFVGMDVLAAEDATTTGRINVYVPPPSYLSHWNTNDGSNGAQTVGESITRTVARISTPTTEGNPFKTGGWANTDQPTTSSGTVTFTTPANTTGFGGDSKFTITVYDADGTTSLVTYTTPSITGNNTFTSGAISVVISGYAPDTDRFQAKASITVNIASLLSNGGRYYVKVSHMPDSATDGTGPYEYTQNDVFYDAPTALPTVSTLTVGETAGQLVTKYISGVKYYTTGNKFTIAATSIDGHNSNTQKIGSSVNITASNFGVADIGASPFGTGSGNFTGYNSQYDKNSIGYSNNSATITASSFRFAGPASASITVSDPFRTSTAKSSSGLGVMIDTYVDDSTSLLETFNGESRRLKSDFTTAWDSSVALSSGDALVYGGSLMVPNRAFTMTPQSTAHGGGTPGTETNFASMLPTQTANYTSLGAPAAYIRKWTETPRDRASFTMAFSGSFPTDALTALKNGDLEIYIYKLDGLGNVGVPPSNVKPIWLHGSTDYNFATFNDGNTQSNAGATCRESSSGNSIGGTFGGYTMRGGIATRIVIKNTAIRIDSIQITFY